MSKGQTAAQAATVINEQNSHSDVLFAYALALAIVISLALAVLWASGLFDTLFKKKTRRK